MGKVVGVLLAICMLVVAPVEAAPQVITATGSYTMGDNDSPKIAKSQARAEAMRLAVEKAGVYVESYSATKNMQLTADEVKVISGAVLKVISEDAKPHLVNDVWQYTVDITAEVDTDNIDLEKLMQNRNELLKAQQERDALRAQNAELLAKYKVAQGQAKTELENQIQQNYTLSDALDNCASLISHEYYNEAIRRLSYLIDNLTYKSDTAYYLRGIAYYEIGSYDKAYGDFSDAILYDRDDSEWRAFYYRGLINYDWGKYSDAYNDLKIAWEKSGESDAVVWNALQKAKKKAFKNESALGDILKIIGGAISASGHKNDSQGYYRPSVPPRMEPGLRGPGRW